MLNLSISLEMSAQEKPNNTAFVLNEETLSYQELNLLANKTAQALLKNGLKKGDRVALSCPNIFHFPVVYYGILKAGGVVVPLNISLKQTETAYHLQDAEIKFFFCFQGDRSMPMGEYGFDAFQQTPSCKQFIELLSDFSTKPSQFENTLSLGQFIANESGDFSSTITQADDVAIILYTSGTTGQAKGAQLTHFNMFFNAKVCSELFAMTSQERMLVILPLFHSFGQTVLMNTTILKGSTAILMPRFAPSSALELMIKEKITVFAGVPTIYWALLNHSEIGSYAKKIKNTLRLAVSGGAALPIQILENFKTQFEAPILEGYGLSETSPVACFNHLNKPNKAGSIGTPVWGVSIQIHNKEGKEVTAKEVGEVAIKGHNIMKGYLNRPKDNKEALRNGWFYTGDLGKKDDDGYIYIVDRSKDMIIRGGFNVYPREIEECLIKHKAVSLVAVIGIPDIRNGEEIKAFVQLKPDTDCTKQELLRYCKKHLAVYKYPRTIEIVDTLPISATGKILKRELRAN